MNSNVKESHKLDEELKKTYLFEVICMLLNQTNWFLNAQKQCQQPNVSWFTEHSNLALLIYFRAPPMLSPRVGGQIVHFVHLYKEIFLTKLWKNFEWCKFRLDSNKILSYFHQIRHLKNAIPLICQPHCPGKLAKQCIIFWLKTRTCSSSQNFGLPLKIIWTDRQTLCLKQWL